MFKENCEITYTSGCAMIGRKRYEEFNYIDDGTNITLYPIHNRGQIATRHNDGKWTRYSWILDKTVDILEDITKFEAEYQRIKREEKLNRIIDGNN